MDCGPLPETREVLCEHLHAKVRFLNPALADQVTDMLVSDRSNDEIIELLTSDTLLEENVEKVIASLSDTRSRPDASSFSVLSYTPSTYIQPNSEVRESLGVALFQAVSALEQELCAQITGMLLELPVLTLTQLLNDDRALKEAVNKARGEYMKYIQGEELKRDVSSAPAIPLSKEKEELGEVIYEKLFLKYPSEAAKLTGMLLQMDYKDLVRVIAEPDLLKNKVELALTVLRNEYGTQS
ncbi:uncharacterized protein [Panulirus ornatus]|uniref:uncharacterized protein isoform X1 n=1 Tax=Panulirus ornatus TaxID=150431 RepID=UPI003A836F31